MAESLAEFFLSNFQAHRDERAYGQRCGYRMEWFTYGQVLEMAARFCGELGERGIGKGDRVMLWGENGAEWVAAFFGCAMCGAIVVPMDSGASADFAARVSGQIAAKLWVCSRRHAAESASAAGAVPVILLEDLSKALTHSSATTLPNVAIGRDDTLQIVFTSGTTAEPKGVVITHGNVLANIAPLELEMRRYLKYERWVHPVRFLNLLPLEPCLRAIPRDVSASAAGWDCDFSGGVEAVGDYEYDPAGAGVGAGECAASFAVAEAED